jgi:hypothetical protein
LIKSGDVSRAPERSAYEAVLVFERPGGGHVGYYFGEDATAYHVLGGNQGDAVTIARIARIAVSHADGQPAAP